jgi:hypothetical protein
MAIYRFETATAPWQSQPPPATAQEREKDWESRIVQAQRQNLADTRRLNNPTLETWHQRGWYELFHYRSPFALSFSTGPLSRMRPTFPKASKGQSSTSQQPSQDLVNDAYTPPPTPRTPPTLFKNCDSCHSFLDVRGVSIDTCDWCSGASYYPRSSEPDATDALTFINHLLWANKENMLSYLFEARLEYIARHSACRRALRNLEGARAQSMMRRLHWVSPTGVSLSAPFLTC